MQMQRIDKLVNDVLNALFPKPLLERKVGQRYAPLVTWIQNRHGIKISPDDAIGIIDGIVPETYLYVFRSHSVDSEFRGSDIFGSKYVIVPYNINSHTFDILDLAAGMRTIVESLAFEVPCEIPEEFYNGMTYKIIRTQYTLDPHEYENLKEALSFNTV